MDAQSHFPLAVFQSVGCKLRLIGWRCERCGLEVTHSYGRTQSTISEFPTCLGGNASQHALLVE
jgi:hypothetical protein